MKIYNEPHINSNLRAAWTVIELIFVIIIIGILAALALPRMSATRDDAKLSTTVHNMGVCINDTGTHFVATGLDYNDTVHPTACDLDNTRCYDFTYAINGVDFNVTTNATREVYCADIENVGGHLAQSYNFGGSQIKK